jgi:hypothetical protein
LLASRLSGLLDGPESQLLMSHILGKSQTRELGCHCGCPSKTTRKLQDRIGMIFITWWEGSFSKKERWLKRCTLCWYLSWW